MSIENPSLEVSHPNNPETIGLRYVLGLYEKYATDLQSTRSYLSNLLASQAEGSEQMRMQFDDLDAELMYLLIRDKDPKRVVEISPRDGWSSLWILKALEDNGDGTLFGPGHLDSYDLEDTSTQFIPEELRSMRTMHVGDARVRQDLPEVIDFLLIDSAHNAVFANWYVKNVLPKVKDGSPIVIHDIQQAVVRRIIGTEARFVRKFLNDRGVNFFSMSPVWLEVADDIHRDFVMSYRRIVGIDQVSLHEAKQSPTSWLYSKLMDFAAVSLSGPRIPKKAGNPAIFFLASSAIR